MDGALDRDRHARPDDSTRRFEPGERSIHEHERGERGQHPGEEDPHEEAEATGLVDGWREVEGERHRHRERLTLAASGEVDGQCPPHGAFGRLGRADPQVDAPRLAGDDLEAVVGRRRDRELVRERDGLGRERLELRRVEPHAPRPIAASHELHGPVCGAGPAHGGEPDLRSLHVREEVRQAEIELIARGARRELHARCGPCDQAQIEVERRSRGVGRCCVLRAVSALRVGSRQWQRRLLAGSRISDPALQPGAGGCQGVAADGRAGGVDDDDGEVGLGSAQQARVARQLGRPAAVEEDVGARALRTACGCGCDEGCRPLSDPGVAARRKIRVQLDRRVGHPRPLQLCAVEDALAVDPRDDDDGVGRSRCPNLDVRSRTPRVGKDAEPDQDRVEVERPLSALARRPAARLDDRGSGCLGGSGDRRCDAGERRRQVRELLGGEVRARSRPRGHRRSPHRRCRCSGPGGSPGRQSRSGRRAPPSPPLHRRREACRRGRTHRCGRGGRGRRPRRPARWQGRAGRHPARTPSRSPPRGVPAYRPPRRRSARR